MNVREYFERVFPDDLEILDRPHPNGEPRDNETLGSIAAEMPCNSPCGMACIIAIDAAKGVHNQVLAAFNRNLPRLIDTNLYTALRVVSCYIRG